MLRVCTHLLENQHRREDVQGRIIICYRLACNKGQQDKLALSFPNGMSGEEIEAQLLAGELQSWGGGHLWFVSDFVFVSIAASCPLASAHGAHRPGGEVRTLLLLGHGRDGGDTWWDWLERSPSAGKPG